MKTFYTFISEMAAPREEHRQKIWYHGCTEKAIKGILETKVLKPGNTTDVKSLKMYTPQYNRVYLTPTIEFAMVYSFGGNLSNSKPNSKEAYICVVDGKSLSDIEPDEDIIADLMIYLKYDYKSKRIHIDKENLAKSVADGTLTDEEAKFVIYILDTIIYAAPKKMLELAASGDYGHATRVAKNVIKKFSDEMKIDIINKTAGHKSIAVEGEIPISEIWQLDITKYTEIKNNPERFKEYSKQIYGD